MTAAHLEQMYQVETDREAKAKDAAKNKVKTLLDKAARTQLADAAATRVRGLLIGLTAEKAVTVLNKQVKAPEMILAHKGFGLTQVTGRTKKADLMGDIIAHLFVASCSSQSTKSRSSGGQEGDGAEGGKGDAAGDEGEDDDKEEDEQEEEDGDEDRVESAHRPRSGKQIDHGSDEDDDLEGMNSDGDWV